jgi:ADP-ribose pyrophosphatase
MPSDAKNDTTPQIVYSGQFLRLQKMGRWEYVSRVNAQGAAFILAITDAQEIVLVEQYRIPVGAATIEMPAGLIGDHADTADESIQASALRELEEETGFRGTHATVLLSGPVAPGLTCERLHLVQAHGLTRVHAGGGVDGENITVHVVPLAQAHTWLLAQQGRGCLIEPRVFTGLYFAQHGSDQRAAP